MSQTYTGAIQKVESAFDFVKDQVKAFNEQKQLQLKRKKKIFKHGIVTSIVTILTVVSAMPPHTIGAPETAPVVAEPAFQSSLTLDKQSTTLLVIKQDTVQITPGKSLAEEQADEQARQQAARLAALRAQTVMANDTTTQYAPSAEVAHQLAQQAAAQAGIADQWKILASVWQVESGKAMYTCEVSRADGQAVGPLQFMPSTFHSHAASGANICDAHDALVAAANLLRDAGLDRGDATSALLSYNHSMSYVYSVEHLADSIN